LLLCAAQAALYVHYDDIEYVIIETNV